MIVSKAGTLAGVKRHDYLPFGEELSAGIGGRTTTQGYTGDSVRQKFTGYEADAETGLNFAQARHHSSAQGRFTSVDPLDASADGAEPQSFNRYSYALNNPTNLTDPDGMMPSAGQSWGDVAGMFWGSSFNFDTPPTQNHIAEALARHDSIITTGYDPAFGHYRGQVEVEYIANAGYVATTTLNNPTPEELGQTMDFMANSSDLLAHKGPRGVRRSGRNSSPKSDPKNWTWVPTGRGRGYWHYSGSGAFGIPPRPTGRTPGFVGGVRVEHHGRVIYQGIVDLRSTFARVQRGRNGLLRSYPHDGSLFFNREGVLPQQFPGYYREYVIPSPGITGAGPQRLVVGLAGEAYYTPNHYKSFVPVGTIPNYPIW